MELELARVNGELALVRMERDILKKRPRPLTGNRCKARGDAAEATEISAFDAVRVLDVSASGFHARLSRGPSRRAQEEPRLEIEIRAAHCRLSN